jgi:hypothetical protein
MIIQINNYDPEVYAFVLDRFVNHQFIADKPIRIKDYDPEFTKSLNKGDFDSIPYDTDTNEWFIRETPESYLLYLRYLSVHNSFHKRGHKIEAKSAAGGNKRNSRKKRRRSKTTRKTTRKN